MIHRKCGNIKKETVNQLDHDQHDRLTWMYIAKANIYSKRCEVKNL